MKESKNGYGLESYDERNERELEFLFFIETKLVAVGSFEDFELV
jgi:hypothetical protein